MMADASKVIMGWDTCTNESLHGLRASQLSKRIHVGHNLFKLYSLTTALQHELGGPLYRLKVAEACLGPDGVPQYFRESITKEQYLYDQNVRRKKSEKYRKRREELKREKAVRKRKAKKKDKANPSHTYKTEKLITAGSPNKPPKKKRRTQKELSVLWEQGQRIKLWKCPVCERVYTIGSKKKHAGSCLPKEQEAEPGM